jgi:hypothetical protein
MVLYKVKTKQRKKGDGELVHPVLFDAAPSRSLGTIVNLSTCQLVFIQIKLLQIRQFDDFRRNWTYTKSRQNSEVHLGLFDEELCLQDHWVKCEFIDLSAGLHIN